MNIKKVFLGAFSVFVRKKGFCDSVKGANPTKENKLGQTPLFLQHFTTMNKPSIF